jgi:creatinine amidohydrolase
MIVTAILLCLFAQDFEMMTWPEVKQALAAGKTTALIYNGGTEHRGPQNVNGGHTLMGHATVVAIAKKLGNAIATPVLPFSPNNAEPAFPGTIGLPGPLFAAINEQIAEQMIRNGFKNIVLMGDHGGGQKELGEVASKLNQKYSPQGIHVIYCDDVYQKANADFDKWLTANHLPLSTHAGIPDTSEMLYLGGDQGWVRQELIPTAVGVDKGIHGDARPSTAELGKRIFDMKVDAAVDQIRRLLHQ